MRKGEIEQGKPPNVGWWPDLTRKCTRKGDRSPRKTRVFMAQNRIVAVLTKRVPFFKNLVIRVAVRFFSGVPHPHLLGVCCPNIFLLVA